MKKILLDSHTLFWFIDGNSRLSDAARGAIEAIDCTVCVSAVTAWEIASKFRLGKWPRAQALANDLPGIMSSHGFEPLPLSQPGRTHELGCGVRKRTENAPSLEIGRLDLEPADDSSNAHLHRTATDDRGQELAGEELLLRGREPAKSIVDVLGFVHRGRCREPSGTRRLAPLGSRGLLH